MPIKYADAGVAGLDYFAQMFIYFTSSRASAALIHEKEIETRYAPRSS
jgi:hypothetical protein